VRRYLAAYQAHGFESLLPKTRRDAGQPRVIDQAVIAQAIALREQQPSRTTPMIAEILKREGKLVNPHTLTTHLRMAGKTRRLLRTDHVAYKRFERDHVNALWQSDASDGPWLPDPDRMVPNRMRRTHLIAFVDDHSRLVTYAQFFFDEALPRLERVFKVALLRHGVPAAIYVDNGAIFNANQFRAACATLRTEVIYASPYHPRGKGKIEQLWNQIQTSFYPEVAASNITDLDTLNQSLWAWLDRIYHVREHGETGQTPFARFAAGADQIRIVDGPSKGHLPETLRLAFQWRATRSVSRQATIKFQGNTYHVDPAWCGQVIELRFDP